jgi:hypothetical protein
VTLSYILFTRHKYTVYFVFTCISVSLLMYDVSRYQPLEAVDLSCQSGVPGDLSLLPKPVFQAYFNLYAGRNRLPRVDTLATLGGGGSQGSKNCAAAVFNRC